MLGALAVKTHKLTCLEHVMGFIEWACSFQVPWWAKSRQIGWTVILYKIIIYLFYHNVACWGLYWNSFSLLFIKYLHRSYYFLSVINLPLTLCQLLCFVGYAMQSSRGFALWQLACFSCQEQKVWLAYCKDIRKYNERWDGKLGSEQNLVDMGWGQKSRRQKTSSGYWH